MKSPCLENREVSAEEISLQAYLLGTLDFESALAFQKRLHFEISGDRTTAALILCEHWPVITVGRQGSRAHILCEPEELQSRQWRVRWVNRGGGCLLHVPGQLALYPILPLDALGLNVTGFLEKLAAMVKDLVGEFDVRRPVTSTLDGVWIGSRPLAGIGVAVRHWVSYYGLYLNVQPALDLFRLVRFGQASRLHSLPANERAGGSDIMTSLERERGRPLRPALVRERLLEHFCRRFSCTKVSFFSDHPSLGRSKKIPKIF